MADGLRGLSPAWEVAGLLGAPEEIGNPSPRSQEDGEPWGPSGDSQPSHSRAAPDLPPARRSWDRRWWPDLLPGAVTCPALLPSGHCPFGRSQGKRNEGKLAASHIPDPNPARSGLPPGGPVWGGCVPACDSDSDSGDCRRGQDRAGQDRTGQTSNPGAEEQATLPLSLDTLQLGHLHGRAATA